MPGFRKKVLKPYSLKLFNLVSPPLRPKNQDEPKARSGHRMVADKNNVYIFGGFNPDEMTHAGIGHVPSPLLTDLWQYNIPSKKWKKIAMNGNVPQEVASHTVWLLGKYLIVYGGTNVPFAHRIGDTVHYFDFKSKSWGQLETKGDLPPKRYGQGMLINERTGKMIVVGGTNGTEYFMDVHVLDLYTHTWHRAYEHPTNSDIPGSYRHEIALWEQKIYVFGGGTDTEAYSLERIPVFNLETETWEFIQTKPDPTKKYPPHRKFHALSQKNKDVYISGGQGERSLDDIWHFDLETLSWTCLEQKLPKPIYFHSMAINEDGQLFIFGGVATSRSGVVRVNNFSSIWVQIPPLSTIALESLTHYFPDLVSPSKAKKYGLPPPLPDRFIC